MAAATKPTAPAADSPFAERGMAVALVELATARGQEVEDVPPTAMAEMGLPDPLPRRVMDLAHTLQRRQIDAMLWRCNRPLNECAPQLSPRDAARYVELGGARPGEQPTNPKITRPTAPPVAAEAPKPRPVAFGVAGLFNGE